MLLMHIFPRQTMVLVFYLLCTIFMMVVRPWLNRIFLKKAKSAVYCALYFLPILSLLHTVAGGLICKFSHLNVLAINWTMSGFLLIADYAFPYLSVIISMISNAAHFSLKLDQSMKALLCTSVTEMKNTVIIGEYRCFIILKILCLNLASCWEINTKNMQSHYSQNFQQHVVRSESNIQNQWGSCLLGTLLFLESSWTLQKQIFGTHLEFLSFAYINVGTTTNRAGLMVRCYSYLSHCIFTFIQ